jgi:hypothetical protein
MSSWFLIFFFSYCHAGPIHTLIFNEGFCVTGSEDRFLRVWPLDFSDFFLEAEHDAPVVAADVRYALRCFLLFCWLVGWSVGRSVGWLIGLLVGWLVG